MAKKLFVGSLSWDTTDSSLKDFFSSVGTVISAQIITDKFTGKARGFGFVEMSTEEEAEKAIQELNEKSLDGRTIVVNMAKEREDRGNGGGGYGGNNGGFSRDSRGPRRDGGNGGSQGGFNRNSSSRNRR